MPTRDGVRTAAAASTAVAALTAVALARGEAPPHSAAPAGAAPALAEGAELGPRLEWIAPDPCPQREIVLSRAAVLAARDDVSWTRFQRIRGVMQASAGGFELALEFVTTDGVRRRAMRSAVCAELADAAAVAIVLAHRSEESASAEEDVIPESGDARRAQPAAPLAAPLTPALASDSAAGRAAVSSEGLAELAVTAQAMLDPTTLGPAAFGAGAGLALRSGGWSASLFATIFPPVASSLGSGEAIDIGLWTGGVLGCRDWGQGFDTCVMAELGRVAAQGVGLNEARGARDLWAAPGLSAGLTSRPFDGFGITTRLSVFHPLIRGRFRVDESEVVHRIPAVGLRAALGIDVPLL